MVIHMEWVKLIFGLGKKTMKKANLYIKNIIEYVNSYDGGNLALVNN